MIDIFIIDDDPAFAESIRLLLERREEIAEVKYFASLGYYLEKLDLSRKTTNTTIVLLDIELGNINSIDHLKKIILLNPEARVLMLSGFLDSKYIAEAIKRGASGYMLKGSNEDQLMEAIHTVANGGHYFDPRTSTAIIELILAHKSSSSKGEEPELASSLNMREKQVARGLIAGMTYQEVADQNNLSLNTIRHYVQTLYRKLNVHNKMQLIKKLSGKI